MNAEHQARLDDIRSGPWREQSLLARRHVEAFSAAQASRYFRSHHDDPDGITDRNEIEFRESFDQALEELQLLELAVACGYLPLAAVQSEAETELRTLLASSPAKSYIVTYDFVPVRFLAARVGVDLGLSAVTVPSVNPKAAVRYAAFLANHSEFIASVPVTKFTMLLDDYRFAGLIDAPFFKDRLALTSPALTESLPPVFDTLCSGLVQFVQSLGDLFLQLEPEERPLFGCLYAYWTSHFLGVRRVKGGYRSMGTSFEDVNPNPLLFPPDLEPAALRSEQQRIRNRIAVLRGVWDQTRALIESLA